MPFLTRSLQNDRVLFFCKADDAFRGKIFVTVGDGEPIRLATGFPENAVECSPTAWHDESGWHVSFVALDEQGVYRLYRMDGEMLDSLSQPISLRIARTGFVYKDRIAVGEVQDVVHIHDPNGDHKIEIPGAYLYRVSYRADAPEKILISGSWIGEGDDVFCLEYDLTADTQRYLECDGNPAYKCTIYGDEILYAERQGEHFEQRRLRHSKDIHGVRSQIAHRHRGHEAPLAVTKKCGCRLSDREKEENDPSVRPSCHECVEKHLGAAMVLLSEIHHGYEYRLRFVGHLHEAEEESQQWPQLHEMIRNTRKAYQRDGVVPDWVSLAQELTDAR